MRDAKIAVRAAGNYLAKKALFLEKAVYEQLDAFVASAWKAIVAREIVIEVGPQSLDGIRRDDEDFRADAEGRVKELEQLVRARFWRLPAEDGPPGGATKLKVGDRHSPEAIG